MTKLEDFMNQGNEKINLTILSIIAIAVAIGSAFISNAVLRAVLMLIVFTPCVAVVSVYAVTKIAVGYFKNHGVRFADGEKIDRLSYVSKVCFDRAAVDRLDNPKKVIDSLDKLCVEPVLITSEDEDYARALAKELGIYSYIANSNHNSRLDYIKESQELGHKICMVGSCSCGLASFVLPEEHLPQIPHLISIARGMRKTSAVNLALSIIFNVLIVALGFTGIFSPAVAAYTSLLGSAIIVVNAAIMTDNKKDNHSLCEEWPVTYDEMVKAQLSTPDLCAFR